MKLYLIGYNNYRSATSEHQRLDFINFPKNKKAPSSI